MIHKVLNVLIKYNLSLKKYTKNNIEISQAKCTIFKTFQISITKFQPKLIRKKYINTYNYFLPSIILRKQIFFLTKLKDL